MVPAVLPQDPRLTLQASAMSATRRIRSRGAVAVTELLVRRASANAILPARPAVLVSAKGQDAVDGVWLPGVGPDVPAFWSPGASPAVATGVSPSVVSTENWMRLTVRTWTAGFEMRS